MSTGLKKVSILEEQEKKIAEVLAAVSPLTERSSGFSSDESIARYLTAQNWNVKKAIKMLKATLKWRFEYEPENIRWEDVASEAESGKMYVSTSVDKKGRPVFIMRPAYQNSNSVAKQIKYVVYCMENLVLNMPQNQEQMILLIDFLNFSLSNVSVKAAKETAHVVQNHYPERLGVAIMYNPPRIFEQFYSVVKSFLDPKTRSKTKFVYANNPNSKKIIEELFDMDQLESAFGGKSSESFNIHKYALRMKDNDEKRRALRAKHLDLFPSTSCDGLTMVRVSLDNDEFYDLSEELESIYGSPTFSPENTPLDFV